MAPASSDRTRLELGRIPKHSQHEATEPQDDNDDDDDDGGSGSGSRPGRLADIDGGQERARKPAGCESGSSNNSTSSSSSGSGSGDGGNNHNN
jgi:hypothetical protein